LGLEPLPAELDRPVHLTHAGDGSGRLFVVEKGGRVRVLRDGAALPTPFLDITPLVRSSGSEQGLLGLAFHPKYAENGRFFVAYTAGGGEQVVEGYRVSADPDVADPGSARTLLRMEDPAPNHNGGLVLFGPDGYLWIGTGDGGGAGDRYGNGQNRGTLLGKMLRIDVDRGDPYAIPPDNPFLNEPGARPEIWALGLRNPFTFAFQPGSTRMFINDVGQNAWEEINDGIAGSNYGWPNCEGACSPANPNFRDPLFQYGHGISATTGCAIAGGAFYNPTTVQFGASYVGKYFFADLCSGWIRLMDPSNNTAMGFASGISNPVDLAVASDGSLYYLARGSSSVFRVQFNGATPPFLVPEQNGDSAAALTSPMAVRDPFPLTDPFNLSSDSPTRVMLFAINLDLLPGEDKSAVTARAEDAAMNTYPLTVEFVGKVSNFDWLTQVVVTLPGNLPPGQSVLVSVTLHGQTSNKVRIRIR
jgi:glucose/arabinose dehydrogenase